MANIDHQFPASGSYIVTLIATNPCGVSLLQQTIEVVVTGVATGEPQGLGAIRLFPNPASDRLTVDCTEARAQPLEIQVFDAGGRLVFSAPFSVRTKIEVPVEGWAAGAYQVRIKFEKELLVRTVVKI